jgi:hypothetical protein
MSSDSEELTIFQTHCKLYKCKVLSFKLINRSATYQ